jgi:hypothetical protein
VVEYEHCPPPKKKRKKSIAGRGLKFGGAENGLLAIALQNSSTIFRHAFHT